MKLVKREDFEMGTDSCVLRLHDASLFSKKHLHSDCKS